MNSFKRAPRKTQLWFTLNELNRFSLSPQLLGVLVGATPYGKLLLLRPYRTVRYWDGFRIAAALPVPRFSRYLTGFGPSCAGNSPLVFTICVVSCWVRSTAKKKCALSFEIGPPKLAPN